MSRLYLDLGNSWMKWRFRNETICHEGGLALSESFNLSDSLIVSALEAEHIYWASVTSDSINDAFLTKMRQKGFNQLTQIHAAHQALGIQSAYEQSDLSLGVDRWLALIGASCQMKNQPICVIDAGTALTLDFLTADRKHLGGFIVPGLSSFNRSLTNQTAQLQTVAFRDSDWQCQLGTNTRDAIAFGICAILSDFLQARLKEFARMQNQVIQVFLTGGQAHLLQTPLSSLGAQFRLHVIHNLVLDGLEAILSEKTS